MKPKYLKIAFSIFVAVATLVYCVGVLMDRPAYVGGDHVVGEAQVGGPFHLIDQEGRPKTEKDLLGKYAIVYFGYTFCPDICPQGLHALSGALERLGEKAKQIQPVFVSVDPQRDHAKMIGQFLKQFHPSFLGLTGSQVEIERAMKAYKVYAAKQVPHHESAHYIVDHSSIFYVMDPAGHYVGHFTHATAEEEMLTLLTKWVK